MLKLDTLCVQLGDHQFSYQLEASSAQVSAVLGKSGSGKSTLLNVIAGFLPAASGSLTWKGESLLSLAANERPVTTLFQQHNLFTHLSVAQNIGLGIDPNLRLNKQDLQSIDRALDEVDLNGYAKKSAANLSGGEQQRVALARCLLRKQPVLLLDEPFSALDEGTRHEMISLTSRVIKDHELCVVLVTHNADDAELLGAKKYLLDNGELKPQTVESRQQTL